MGDLCFKVKDAPPKFQRPLRIKADIGQTEGDNKDHDDKICEPREKIIAAQIMCKGSPKYSEKDLSKAESCLKEVLRISKKKELSEIKGTDMVGNPKFNLTQGKLYGYQGAQVVIKDNRFKVTYKSDSGKNSGVVHTYDGGYWNGKPIDIGHYSTLLIVIEGSAANAKFSINSRDVFDYGQIKSGVNKIDLTKYKKDDFAPMKTINKIEFVNEPGKGEYVVRLVLQ